MTKYTREAIKKLKKRCKYAISLWMRFLEQGMSKVKKQKKPRYEKITILVKAECMSCKFAAVSEQDEDQMICTGDGTETVPDFECPSWRLEYNAFSSTFVEVKEI